MRWLGLVPAAVLLVAVGRMVVDEGGWSALVLATLGTAAVLGGLVWFTSGGL